MGKIRLDGVSFFAYHGVLDSEKKQGQRFVVDCEIELPFDRLNDDLNGTVNYAEAAKLIVETGTGTRFDLIETLADKSAYELILKYAAARAVTVTVHKPSAPIDAEFADVSVSVRRERAVCYLSVGSNLGDREAYLESAWKAVESSEAITGLKKSDYIDTAPYGVTDQPRFLNGVFKIETILTPTELLEFCADCEKKAGRVRTRRWGERTLDVDILLYGDRQIFSDRLKIPHPEMHLREFVLRPLAEIEPYVRHPIIGKTASELLEELTKGGNP